MSDQLSGAVDKAKAFKIQDLTSYVRNLAKEPPTLSTVQPQVLQGIQVSLNMKLVYSTIFAHSQPSLAELLVRLKNLLI